MKTLTLTMDQWMRSLLSFLSFLYYILKQFSLVGSLKEQQAHKQKEHKDFPRGNHKGENPAKLPQYRTQPEQCKTQTTASLFFLVHLFFSLLQTCLSECV